MIIKKTVTYVFEPDEYEAAEIFRSTANPFEWCEDIKYSFPNTTFTKDEQFFVDDAIEHFSEIR